MTPQHFLTPLTIDDADSVYRQANLMHLDTLPGNKKKRYPKELHFKPDEDGLSVHWNQHIKPDNIFHIIGLTYRKDTTEYKDCRQFRLFNLPVDLLRKIEGIEAVDHTPMYNGNPAPLGSPNNYAHASVIYPDDEEIRLKLSDYCQENYEECHCAVDLQMLEKEVVALRLRLDNTEYHRLDLI